MNMINTIIAVMLLMTVALHKKLEGIVELEYWIHITYLQLPCHGTTGKLFDLSECVSPE